MTVDPEMMDPKRYSSLGELLFDALLTFKSETALIEVERKRERHRLTYLETKHQVGRVADHLHACGVGAGDRVAIMMSNQSRWLICAMAAFHRGAVLVPLDYKLGAKEQKELLVHSRPKVLFSERGLLDRFKSAPPDVETIFAVDEQWDTLPEQADPPPIVPRERDDVATIVYSSGTGGVAKGCLLTHDAYLEQLHGLMTRFPMHTGHRVFSILPTNHAIDFMVGFVGPFTAGATVIHQRTLRPEFLQWTMRAYGVTHMALVPLILSAFERSIQDTLLERPRWAQRMVSVLGGLNEMLTAKKPNPALSRALLKPVHDAFGGELELLFCGGAFVDRQRAELFYRLGLPVVIGYGLTEVCTVATVNDLSPFRSDTVGRALDGVQIRIDSPGADGVGEVWIKGRTLMRGYLDEPELTAETITEDGWLKTGDLGWLDAAHHLHLVGRRKNMIVTAGGKNVYPEDVESAFEELEVEELAVFASGFLWPTELVDEQLVAVVVPRRGDAVRAPSKDAVLAQLKAKNRRLPDYKRLGAVLFWDGAFPRTASMKVKRNDLAESLRDEAGDLPLVAL